MRDSKPVKYDINRPWLTLDPWQKRYIETQGNCFLLCSRQSGKSAAMSIKAAKSALAEQEPCDYLVIAYTEKQAYNLFFKILSYLEAEHPDEIRRGDHKPTRHEINLKNGVCIMCYAAGLTGGGLRGYSVKKLFVDEAAQMDREVFVSIMPMLSVTGGTIDMASTPLGKEGYFYECSDDVSLGSKIRKDFTRFYVSAEDCPRHSKQFLESEKASMSALKYAQEYLAVFLDDLKRLFSTELIKDRAIGKVREPLPRNRKCLGVDIAGMGEDLTTYEIIEEVGDKRYEHIYHYQVGKTFTNDVVDEILRLDRLYNFDKILIDDGGLGFGVYSYLHNNDITRKRTFAINNSKREKKEGGDKKTLQKEELYLEFLGAMERKEIILLNEEEVKTSLSTVQKEWSVVPGRRTDLLIYGRDTHAAEGLIRALGGFRDKTNKLWCR